VPGMWKRKLEAEAVEAVTFLWKRKHFEERSWKRLIFCGSGSTLKKEAGSGSKRESD